MGVLFCTGSRLMAEFIIQVGARSAQGVRSNNEDRFVADASNNVFLVADGMGGQDFGERASGLAAEIIPLRPRAQPGCPGRRQHRHRQGAR